MTDITMVQKDEQIIGMIEIDHDLQAVYYRRRESGELVDGSCMDLYGLPAQDIINQLFH